MSYPANIRLTHPACFSYNEMVFQKKSPHGGRMEINMKSKLRILIAGGDMRQVYCARRLSDTYDTGITGFDKELLPAGSPPLVQSNVDLFDCAVLPVPPLNETGLISTPCSGGELSTEEVKKLLKPDGIIFAGRTDRQLRETFRGYEICDYMECEDLNLKNAVPTAEGAVQIALDELPVTISGLRVLIVGMGRIGRALAEILKGFGADVTAAVHNAKGAANARIHGIKSVCTNSMDSDYSLVFNTVPHIIFDSELLSRFGEKTLFIDLASKPGGIDFDAASKLGIKAIWALGLPGKTAPITSGEIIAETVSGILSEKEIANG